MSEETFSAYVCHAKSQPLEKSEVNFCTWDENMVQMDIICCGVCGTDLHTIDEGWGPTEFPCVVGHEIIGKVTKVGSNVKKIKVGDRCGVGCQSASCHECDYCKKGMENLCSVHAVWSFNDRYENATKDKTYGGFAEKWRGPQDFVVKIPDNFSSEVAASFLCGGVTTFTPLKRYNVSKGDKVAVLGLGGLGHFGVQWAKAMGAEVIAFDVIPDKVEDAKKLGCDGYVLIFKMNYETVVTWLTENDTHFPFNATWEHVKSIMQNAIKELWNTNITSIVYKIINNPHILCEYYKNYDSFVIASFLSTILAIIHYISSEITHDYSQVDRAWSLLPVIYAWHFTIHDYLSNGMLNVRLVAASIIISLWGARLTYNFARKGGYYSSGQDYRYPYLLEKVGPVLMAILNITFIATVQNFLLLLLASPLYIVSQVSNKTSCLSTFDWIIIATHLSLLFIEAVADEQQYAFQTAKHALLEYLQPSQLKDDFKNGFLWHSGLFQYSRHPNFFAEMAMWWVIYFFSVSAIQEAIGLNGLSTFFNWTIAGPAALTAVIYSSTKLTESISSGKYPNYSVYQKNVNKFLPWFPSKDQTSTKPSSKKD